MRIDTQGKLLTLALGTLKLTCRPCTTALMYAAVAAARERLQAELAAGTLPDQPAEREGRYRSLHAAELARRAATAWEGARDGKGKTLAFSSEAIAAAMERHFTLADSFLSQYAAREDAWMLEGNDFEASPSGTGAQAQTTAPPAESSAAPAAKSKTVPVPTENTAP